ncbi:MAG: hypothetical protein HY738_14265 [Bacteroidia bacterium]|nr:hypothetical protein [Bacteroidia bacterium]
MKNIRFNRHIVFSLLFLMVSIVFISTCKKLEKVPAVTTSDIFVTDTAVIAHGTVVDIGEGNTTAHGFCWAKTATPTISDSKISLGAASQTGAYQSEITGLEPSTIYYLRAYISTPDETKYGEVKSFTTPVFLPSVTTTPISSITPSTASSGGTVTDNGGATVTARGVCWSTSQNPTTANSTTFDGTGTGSFTISITGLSAGITYYVRAYATNSAGTSYGNQVNFATLDDDTPCDGITSFNYGGQTYGTVEIGYQCWMAENLNIGTMINSTEGGQLQTDNALIEKYCYNNNSASCDTYGGLYEWNEMMQYNPSDADNPGTTQGICPQGWHLPIDVEWTALSDYLGGESVAGGKMKETTQWIMPNIGATNESGFTALPGGYRLNFDGSFIAPLDYCAFWSATENSSTNAWMRDLFNESAGVGRYDDGKTNGFSVRCFKDD